MVGGLTAVEVPIPPPARERPQGIRGEIKKKKKKKRERERERYKETPLDHEL